MPLHPWQWPTHPWTRLQIDFAGPVDGKMLLIIVDSHSKWIEAFSMTMCIFNDKRHKLCFFRQLFVQFGVPESIVSDNGAQFIAAEFKKFCRMNGIRHIQTAPYHLSSNGMAERAVQVVKQGIKKQSRGTLNDKISRVLFQYRITPHSTTGSSPSELLIGRRLRSRLDLLKPCTDEKVVAKQLKQKESHDKRCRQCTFSVGEKVYVKSNRKGKNWLSGFIVRETGPVSFQVKLEDGKTIRFDQDQLRQRYNDIDIEDKDTPLLDDDDLTMFPNSFTPPDVTVDSSSETVERRYPSRVRQPPNHYIEESDT